ncbi:MAG: Nif11-like leader peptide family natural product precursor [Cyanobacteria bacterium J06559_3]
MKEALNAMPNPNDFVLLAKQYGYDFTIEEWQETMRFSVEELKCELSEIPGI